jgi:hypothetical protein
VISDLSSGFGTNNPMPDPYSEWCPWLTDREHVPNA